MSDFTEDTTPGARRLRFAKRRDFQEQIAGLDADGEFGPQTHRALCFFERQRPDGALFVMHVRDREPIMRKVCKSSTFASRKGEAPGAWAGGGSTTERV